jgi:hypothetical protein
MNKVNTNINIIDILIAAHGQSVGDHEGRGTTVLANSPRREHPAIAACSAPSGG